MADIEKLQELIDSSNKIVFFGGAGVSTESGIPDFRSVDGLYHQKFKYPPETMLSHSFYVSHKDEFYEFYREKLLLKVVGTPEEPKAEPNAAHKFLAELEKAGKLSAVVTQNIDGLHQAAGSKNVYELHGSVLRNYCQKCGKLYSAEDIFNSNGVPKCSCGGDIKPDVVLYEEGLDNDIMLGAVRAISEADMLIIGGTSLVVYPAAGLIRYFGGKHLILINRDETPYDHLAEYVIHDDLSSVFGEFLK